MKREAFIKIINSIRNDKESCWLIKTDIPNTSYNSYIYHNLHDNNKYQQFNDILDIAEDYVAIQETIKYDNSMHRTKTYIHYIEYERITAIEQRFYKIINSYGWEE